MDVVIRSCKTIVLTYWLYTKLIKSKVKDGHNKNMGCESIWMCL